MCDNLSWRNVRNIEIDKEKWMSLLTWSDHYSPLIDLLMYPHPPFICPKKIFSDKNFFRKKSLYTFGEGAESMSWIIVKLTPPKPILQLTLSLNIGNFEEKKINDSLSFLRIRLSCGLPKGKKIHGVSVNKIKTMGQVFTDPKLI